MALFIIFDKKMKFTGYVLFLLMIANCNAQKSLDYKEIRYVASTRGINIELKVTDSLIIYKKNQETTKVQVTSKTWKEITVLLSKIEVLKIETFVPPSEERFSDKALHATLTIIIDTKEHASQTFDHGNPPKELKALLEYLFSIVEIK